MVTGSVSAVAATAAVAEELGCWLKTFADEEEKTSSLLQHTHDLTGGQVELKQRSEVTSIITVIHPLGSSNIITASLQTHEVMLRSSRLRTV